MATNAKRPRGEKTEAARNYMVQNPQASVAEVVAELEKQGLTISSAMVYNLRTAGKKPGGKKVGGKKTGAKRGRKPAAAAAEKTSDHGKKSEAVRAAIRELGRRTPAKQIHDHLTAQGIVVSLPLVIKIKSKMKARRMARRQGRSAGQTAAPRTAASSTGVITSVGLMAAKELADRLGGVDSLRKTLDVLDRLR